MPEFTTDVNHSPASNSVTTAYKFTHRSTSPSITSATSNSTPAQTLSYAPAMSVRAPAVDIYDTPDSFRVNVALPGVPADHIVIDFQYPSHELVIQGEVPAVLPFNTVTPAGVDEHDRYRAEYLKVAECWPTGNRFMRRIKFPGNSKVDGTKVTADLKFGVVYITVPKV